MAERQTMNVDYNSMIVVGLFLVMVASLIR